MDAEFYAYDNGAVILSIQENYPILLKKRDNYISLSFANVQRSFFDKFYIAFEHAEHLRG